MVASSSNDRQTFFLGLLYFQFVLTIIFRLLRDSEKIPLTNRLDSPVFRVWSTCGARSPANSEMISS